ncbi:unnamed protein product [Caenorhabditis angaria]|uniref:Uncharacterized protein n=1 Tax=Caenorhabditis angaria TaxID=860376 RepID=A0A9P1IBL6_9PELO|nr:unnamed protein product [Caenorhabditis angaria]
MIMTNGPEFEKVPSFSANSANSEKPEESTTTKSPLLEDESMKNVEPVKKNEKAGSIASIEAQLPEVSLWEGTN